jgi:glycosyltransferase involved in cell wall biosynthesis
MAAGLPVIATKTGGITDQVIPEITGLLIPVGDVKGLGQSILRLIEDDEERLKMGLAGRRRAIEEFDIEKRVDRLISVYNQLLSHEK